MKKFLIIVLVAFGMNVGAQPVHEYSYPMSGFSDWLYFLRLESSGNKYFKINIPANQIVLYNLNHSFYKQISIPVQRDTFKYQIWHIAEKLFDNDSTDIDYLLSGCGGGCGPSPYSPPYVKIYNENGSVMFSKDTATMTGGGGFSGGATERLPIYNTDSGTKLILETSSTWPPFLSTQSHVYSLPGKLNCGCSIFGSNVMTGSESVVSNPYQFTSNPYPNPTSGSTRIDYTFPPGVIQGEIVFYDMQGKEVKRYKVDKTFDHLLISTADIQAGTYFYQLQTSAAASAGKKMVVIK